MKGLLLKDIFMIKNQLKNLLVILIMFGLLSIINNDSSFVMFLIPFYMVMVLITTFSYDEFNHFDIYGNSLPFQRGQIVKAKYLLFHSSNILLLVLGLGLALVGPLVSEKIVMSSVLSTLVGVIFGISLIISILIPFYYKYGAQKGRIMLFAVIIGISLLGGLLFQIVKISGADVSFVISFLNGINIWLMMGILLLITFFIIYISYRISCRIYEKKEF